MEMEGANLYRSDDDARLHWSVSPLADRTAFLRGPTVQHLQSKSHRLPIADKQHESPVSCEQPQQQADDWQHCAQQQAVSQQQVAKAHDGNAISKQTIAIVI